MTTTHNHKSNFGRRVAGCPRCEELNQGAKPVVWNIRRRQEQTRQFIAEIRAHDCKARGCGPVCTFGDW